MNGFLEEVLVQHPDLAELYKEAETEEERNKILIKIAIKAGLG